MNRDHASHFDTRHDPAGSADIALRIDQMQCLNLRARHVTCTECADACTATALELAADEVRLTAARCTGCGACLPVCPSGAMLLAEFDPRRFLQTMAGAAEVHIHCSRSKQADAGNIVPCLQVLDARLLAAAAADGVQRVVLHGSDQCADCIHGDARAAIEQIHADLEKWFTEVPVHLVQQSQLQSGTGERPAEEQVQLGRRNFLRFAGAQVADSASRWFAEAAPQEGAAASRRPVLSNDGGAHRPSAYQELLGERAASLPWRDQGLPWRPRVFSDVCSACLTCAEHCPTGALVTEETTSAISIRFHLRLCTDCGLCERLCPDSAISCASVANSRELCAPAYCVLHRGLRRCAGCACSFVPGPDTAELCTTCQNERAVVNDWKAMLNESS